MLMFILICIISKQRCQQGFTCSMKFNQMFPTDYSAKEHEGLFQFQQINSPISMQAHRRNENGDLKFINSQDNPPKTSKPVKGRLITGRIYESLHALLFKSFCLNKDLPVTYLKSLETRRLQNHVSYVSGFQVFIFQLFFREGRNCSRCQREHIQWLSSF